MNQKPGASHRVNAAEAGRTLGGFLRERLAPLSWSRVQKLVRGRHVLIHGNLCTDQARRLRDGDVVKVLEVPAAAPPRSDDLRIVHLDDEVVVVDKPPGITTTRHHEEAGWPARRRQLQPTLDELVPDAIARHLAAQAGRGGRGRSRSLPVKAVHRIDRDTSGLVVFARTVPASRILAEQFRLHATHRRYLALVTGRVTARSIRTRLVRDRGDGRRGSTPDAGEGKEAVTHVSPLEQLGGDYTLVECRLETGRTHQIRIQMAEIGHPVCGERVYRPPRGPAAADRSGAPRIMLHAAELGFVHPVSGESLRFSSPLPADIRRVLAGLRAAEKPESRS